MLLAIDVGNTNSVFSVSKNKKILSEWRCSTDGNMTADQYFTWLQQLFNIANINYKEINKTIVSSVVPDSIFNLKVLCKTYFKCTPLIVGSDNCKIPISIDVERGVNVGADRLVNAIAAYQLVGGNTIVVDFGTATTFDVIKKNNYLGGVIAPGVTLSLDNLIKKASLIPNIELHKSKSIIGKNTKQAVLSGFFWGYNGLINGIISKIKKKNNQKYKIIFTGGLAHLFNKDIKDRITIDKNLTINGLIKVSKHFNL